MPLTVLYSVSLLALVVTARPIVQESPEFFLKRPQEVQDAIQAIFESHTGQRPDCLECEPDDITVRLTSAEEQNAFLAQLDIGDVHAVLPLQQDGIPEKKLHEIITDSNESGTTSLDDVDGGERPLEEVLADLAAEEESAKESENDDAGAADPVADTGSLLDLHHLLTPHTLILVLSCGAAILFFGCVATVAYIASFVRARLLRDPSTWEALGKAEKKGELVDGEEMDGQGGGGIFAQVTRLRIAELQEKDAVDEKDRAVDSDLTDDEAVEKDQDAEGSDDDGASTPTAEHPDPDLLPLPLSAPSGLTAPEMREVHIDVDHPIRAVYPLTDADVPARTHRGAYAAPIPEMDFALARQLYAPFALDGTWVVRFVFTFFGWFSMMVGGIN